MSDQEVESATVTEEEKKPETAPVVAQPETAPASAPKKNMHELIPLDPNTGELKPQNMAQMVHLAKVFYDSQLVSPSFPNAQSVFVAMQSAREMGLGMMSVLNNGYVVKNRLKLHSGLPMALVRKHPDLIHYREWLIDEKNKEMSLENGNIDVQPYAGCAEIQRQGMKEPYKTVFTIHDAGRANLLKKDNWKNYPKRMLLARARMMALDYTFADALCGMNDYDETQPQGSKPITKSETNAELEEDLAE